MSSNPKFAPEGAAVTRFQHEVAFYETDAMGVVHHSNYLRFIERARVRFMAEHDQAYAKYVNQGYHVPVTRAAVTYKRPCRFSEIITIECWLAWVRHASFGFAYRLEVAGQLVALAETDHAIIDAEGRPQRIPLAMKAQMESWFAATKGES